MEVAAEVGAVGVESRRGIVEQRVAGGGASGTPMRALEHSLPTPGPTSEKPGRGHQSEDASSSCPYLAASLPKTGEA